MNTLYYGGNLDVIRHHLKDEAVDLVCLDPPLNTNANHNVLFHKHGKTKPSSRVMVFEDAWHHEITTLSPYSYLASDFPRRTTQNTLSHVAPRSY